MANMTASAESCSHKIKTVTWTQTPPLLLLLCSCDELQNGQQVHTPVASPCNFACYPNCRPAWDSTGLECCCMCNAPL